MYCVLIPDIHLLLKPFRCSALREAFPGEIAAKGVIITGAQNTEPLTGPAIASTSAKRDISIQRGLYHDGAAGILTANAHQVRVGTEFMGLDSGSRRSSICLPLRLTLYTTCCASRTWGPRTHAYILQAAFYCLSRTTSHSKHRTPHSTSI